MNYVEGGAGGQAPFLSLRDLTKEYAAFTAVSRLNLDVAKGELIAFLGPSGCGKTTSLRMIAGLIPATSGQILVAGQDLTNVPPYRRDMGLVFQSYALFPHMSVAANIAFGLKMRKIGRAETAERVGEAIALVRLQGKEDRRPAQLSGGQQQRVALARALVVRPQILLLDEPLSNLDAKLRDEMRTEIREIQQRIGITAIFVTHDQSEALTMCDKVAVLNAGGLEQVGTPQDLYERPATPFVAGFVGRTNRLTVTAQNGVVDLGGTALRLQSHQGGPLTLLMRPHRIQITAGHPTSNNTTSPAGEYSITGSVLRATYAGDLLQYEVTVGPHLVQVERATTAGEPLLDPGTPVTLRWRIEDTLVFEGTS
jgi:putative spermidine/putrescine transport system ATP-binding protein